jgi:hypothetical protein
MIDNLVQESLDILQEDFYNKKFYFSYSSLSKLLWNPAIFYQLYVAGIKEEKIESHLVNGKLIHVFLLEPDKFDEQFVISPDNLPTGNLRLTIAMLFKKIANPQGELVDYSNELLDIMKQINYYQNLLTDQQRLNKVITVETNNYWTFLKQKGNKLLIDQANYDYCQKAVEIVKINSKVCQLIGCNTSEFDSKEIYNELELSIDINNKPFGLKGIIDNLVIDHDKKIIYINDIKTTSKELKDFKDTVEFYSYWLQAVIYCSLVATTYAKLIENGYDMQFHFITIDSSFQSYAFPVSNDTIATWFDRLEESLKKALWHYETKSYDLPYDFATGSITL